MARRLVVLCISLASCAAPRTATAPAAASAPAHAPRPARKCAQPILAEPAGLTASCRDLDTVLRWDPTPIPVDPEIDLTDFRIVSIERDGGERSFYRCNTEWLLGIAATGVCPAAARSCSLDRRVSRQSSSVYRIEYSDGRTLTVLDEDGDGCPERIESHYEEANGPVVEEIDQDADGHPEVRTSRRQLPCGLPDRGQPVSAAGCRTEFIVECDRNSDGVIDARCHSLDQRCDAVDPCENRSSGR